MNKSEIQQRLTSAVIDQLQHGTVPWLTPWVSNGYVPTSLQTGKAYRGFNRMLLTMLGGKYDRSLWVTFKQAKYLGGTVMRGEHGLPIIYYSMISKRDKETGEEFRVPLLRMSTVFNVEQCKDVTIPAKLMVKREPVPTLAGINTLLDKYTTKPEIHHSASDSAHYSPLFDRINLPMPEQFTSAESMAQTIAHELVHSTGHESRLDRFKGDDKPTQFGCASYAREELVAEIGAVMALAEVGVTIDLAQNASYIAGWLKALENDTSLILSASAKAQKAVDYMLGIKHEDIETADETVTEEVMA